MTIDFSQKATDGVRTLNPYQAGKPISELERELGITNIIKLASNENPLGPSPKAVAAIQKELAEITLYPDANGYYVKESIATKFGLQLNQITLGNGSNDAMDIAVRTFVGAGDEVVCSQYCFIAFPISAQAQGAKIISVPATDYGHDLVAMQKAITPATKMVYVVNPNNPTGNWINENDLRTFLDAVPSNVIVVYDEAYFEYAEGTPGYPNAIKLLQQYPNLIVLRTFSKAYGLAALRLGFALSQAECAGFMNRVRQPFNCSSVALAAGVACLHDEDYIKRVVAMNKTGMQQYETAFNQMGLQFIPSLGNFITVDLKRDAKPVYDAMLREGVIIRPIGNYGLTQHIRISIGTPEQNDRCIRSLRKVLAL